MLITTAAALAAALVPAAPASASCPPSPSTRIDPAAFARRVDNPWFPLVPGSVWRYRGTKDGRRADEVVRATRRTRMIQGVHATAVRDRLALDGRPAEDTTDWYAQDKAGTVWYFGEDRFRVASVGRRVLQTTESTPLEPGVLDGKRYRRGVGTVVEHQLRGGGPPEDLHLVAFRPGR